MREIECKMGVKMRMCVCVHEEKKSYYRKSTINNAISQWAANHYYFGLGILLWFCYEPLLIEIEQAK